MWNLNKTITAPRRESPMKSLIALYNKTISFEFDGYDYFISGTCKNCEKVKLNKEKYSSEYEYLIKDFGVSISKATMDTVWFTRIRGEYSLWRKRRL